MLIRLHLGPKEEGYYFASRMPLTVKSNMNGLVLFRLLIILALLNFWSVSFVTNFLNVKTKVLITFILIITSDLQCIRLFKTKQTQ